MLKVIRTNIKPRDVVIAVTSIAAVVADVSDMASFPPARAAATILLVILQTVQEMKDNKDACCRLARRAAKVLLNLKQRMDGRWDSSPRALVENIQSFEKVLVSIRDFMLELSRVKWMGRLLQKTAIESSLNDYHSLLDEAERSFQIASLVEIHYTVGILQKRSEGSSVEFVEKKIEVDTDLERRDDSLPTPPPPYGRNSQDAMVSTSESISLSEVLREMQISDTSSSGAFIEEDSEVEMTLEPETFEDPADLMKDEMEKLDDLGFKRYHQSDVRLRSSLKSAGSDPFWEGASLADVGGQRAIVKRYDSNDESDARKRWLHDVKMLQSLYHPNLPQLTGFSDDKTPTPFVILAKVKLRDPNAYLWNTLQNKNIAECTCAMLRIYRDVSSAALYVQRQLALDERETQDFVDEASYSLDGDGNVIVGLPPPKPGNSITVRNYRLTESLVGTTLKTLPAKERFDALHGTSQSQSIIDMQNKFWHVKALTGMLLPKEGQSPTLAAYVEELLEDDDDDETLSLSRIREININAGVHDHAWHEGVHGSKVTFDVGDIGYIARDRDRVQMMDKSRFNDFVKIGNVFDMRSALPAHGDEDRLRVELAEPLEGMKIEKEATGQQMQWVNGFMQRCEVWPIVLPCDIEGWPLSLPPQAEISLLVRHSARVFSVNEAWRYLVRQATRIAHEAQVQPNEIILITRSVKGQTYTVRDFSNPATLPGHAPFGRPHPFSPAGRFGHGAHAPPAYTMAQPMFRPPPSQMCYLFTSHVIGFDPFWSDNPSAAAMPPNMRPSLPRNIIQRTGWPEAYIDYIQLSAEDTN